MNLMNVGGRISSLPTAAGHQAAQAKVSITAAQLVVRKPYPRNADRVHASDKANFHEMKTILSA